MKKLAATIAPLLILIFAFPAFGAQPYLFDQTDKSTDHLRAHQAWDTRQGGETIETALEIVLPYTDNGATCDNIDDYDVNCPYLGSTSPDVVYTFVAASSTRISIDLCGSNYDTKVYVWDANLDLVACNDDFYSGPPCGAYVSRLEDVPIQEGSRFYIIIDGYGGDCGEYYIEVEEDCMPPPCSDAVCPDDGVAENEPPLHDGYQDIFNSGCDSPQPVFQELVMPPGQTELNFCGQTGFYITANEILRDQDWFVMVANGNNIHLETSSSHWLPTDCDVLFLDDCANISLLPYQMGICTAGIIDIPTNPGDVVYLRVRPTYETWHECAHREDLYTIKIQGIGETVVATEDVKWGSLKSWFR